MIEFLIAFLVFALVLYVVWWAIGIGLRALNAPPHVHQIIGAILLLVLLAWLLNGIGVIDFDRLTIRVYQR